MLTFSPFPFFCNKMEFYSINRILIRGKKKQKLIWSQIARSSVIRNIIKNAPIKVDNVTPHLIMRGAFFTLTTLQKIIAFLEGNDYIYPITEEYLLTCSHSYLVDYVKLLPSTSSESCNVKKKHKKNKNLKRKRSSLPST